MSSIVICLYFDFIQYTRLLKLFNFSFCKYEGFVLVVHYCNLFYKYPNASHRKGGIAKLRNELSHDSRIITNTANKSIINKQVKISL